MQQFNGPKTPSNKKQELTGSQAQTPSLHLSNSIRSQRVQVNQRCLTNDSVEHATQPKITNISSVNQRSASNFTPQRAPQAATQSSKSNTSIKASNSDKGSTQNYLSKSTVDRLEEKLDQLSRENKKLRKRLDNLENFQKRDYPKEVFYDGKDLIEARHARTPELYALKIARVIFTKDELANGIVTDDGKPVPGSTKKPLSADKLKILKEAVTAKFELTPAQYLAIYPEIKKKINNLSRNIVHTDKKIANNIQGTRKTENDGDQENDDCSLDEEDNEFGDDQENGVEDLNDDL